MPNSQTHQREKKKIQSLFDGVERYLPQTHKSPNTFRVDMSYYF
jgi:hypothetical protein